MICRLQTRVAYSEAFCFYAFYDEQEVSPVVLFVSCTLFLYGIKTLSIIICVAIPSYIIYMHYYINKAKETMKIPKEVIRSHTTEKD